VRTQCSVSVQISLFFSFLFLPACPLKRRSDVHWSVFSSFLKTQKSENSMFCECSVLTFLCLSSFLPPSFLPSFIFVRSLLTVSLLIHHPVWMMIFCSLDPLLFFFHVVIAGLDCGCSCLVMVAALWLWWLMHCCGCCILVVASLCMNNALWLWLWWLLHGF